LPGEELLKDKVVEMGENRSTARIEHFYILESSTKQIVEGMWFWILRLGFE
jgi:hypothetical protein